MKNFLDYKNSFPMNKFKSYNISVIHDGGVWLHCAKMLLQLEAIIRLLEVTSANETGARAISRVLFLQIDVEFVQLLRLFFFRCSWEKSIKYHCCYRTKTDLGKAMQLISLLYENLVNIWNSNLTQFYSDSITELCKKCDFIQAKKT